MNFKQKLITELKQYPDLYNEIRAEAIVSNSEQPTLEEASTYLKPVEDDFLDQISDQELIDSIVDNLKYYIEYEKEMGESDL